MKSAKNLFIVSDLLLKNDKKNLLEDKIVGTAQLNIAQLVSVNFPQQQPPDRWENFKRKTIGNQPRKVWHEDPCHSVDESQNCNKKEENPPNPENEEVLLVEQVVAEDAEEVTLIHASSGGANLNAARHL